MTSLKEKQVEKMLDKMFGSADDALRIVTKLALTNTEITPEVLATLEYLKKQNEEDASGLTEELQMTLDASGNLVPLIGNSSYSATLTPYEPILTQERAGENVVCPITYTIENGVINNLNGLIDCGGNVVNDCGGNVVIDYRGNAVNDVVYRLPVGKT